jgi:hypothetical protein
MTPDQLHTLIQATLASGCGVLISMLYQVFLDNIDPQPTPLAARLTVFVLCLLVPSALYLIGVAFGWWAYDVATNLADVVAAFTASQLFHGVTALSGQPAPPPAPPPNQ